MNGSAWETIDVRRGISLSAICPRDKNAFVHLLNDRDIYDGTLRIPFPYSEDDADVFIQLAMAAAVRRGHPIHYAIRDASGEALGACGFERIVYGHRAEIGYWLGKPYWGQGIMTDVVRRLCEFAEREWELVRVVAHVFDFNQASARVLEKCGFQQEGLLRKHIQKDHRFIDARLYARVR